MPGRGEASHEKGTLRFGAGTWADDCGGGSARERRGARRLRRLAIASASAGGVSHPPDRLRDRMADNAADPLRGLAAAARARLRPRAARGPVQLRAVPGRRVRGVLAAGCRTSACMTYRPKDAYHRR